MQTQGMTLAQRLADAADLIIDFATLGEYGLEVPGADGVLAPGTGRSAHSVARRPGAIAPVPPGRLPRRVKAATAAGRRAGAVEPAAQSCLFVGRY